MAIRGMKTKKIFIGGLTPAVTENELKEYFEQYGPITEVQIVCERDTGKSRGIYYLDRPSQIRSLTLDQTRIWICHI